MQSKARLITALIFLMAVSFVSCKKTDTDPPKTDETTDLSVHSDDEYRFSGEIDAIATDANTVIEGNASFNGRIENILGTICNATAVADSTNDIKKITVTYNGLDCFMKNTVSGTVVLSMPRATHWKDVGAVLTVNIQNLKITRVLDNKSITINGTKTITNVSGGRLRDLASRGTITHTIVGTDLSVTFDNGTQRTWQVAKKRVFTYNNGAVITTTGMHTEDTVDGIAEWGTNRFGKTFATAISQPLVIRQDCDFKLVSGQVTHSKLSANVTVTFGLNAAGEPTSCANVGAGSFYFKLIWQGTNGATGTVILPY